MARFQEALDGQASTPTHFRNINNGLWSKFIDKQIESMHSRSYPTIHFAVATGTTWIIFIVNFRSIQLLGLQYNLYKGTHDSCYFVFNDQLALNHQGKPLTEFKFLWYPTLSPKPMQSHLLKPLK